MNTTARPIALTSPSASVSAPASTTDDVSGHAVAQSWARQVMVMSAVSAIITSTGLLTYDRFVAQPARRLGVVDIAAIYRAKEDEYTRAFYKAAASPATQGAMSGPAQVAQEFVQRLPYALNDLRSECRCVIVVRGAVATLGEGMVDLTPALRSKLGMQP